MHGFRQSGRRDGRAEPKSTSDIDNITVYAFQRSMALQRRTAGHGCKSGRRSGRCSRCSDGFVEGGARRSVFQQADGAVRGNSLSRRPGTGHQAFLCECSSFCTGPRDQAGSVRQPASRRRRSTLPRAHSGDRRPFKWSGRPLTKRQTPSSCGCRPLSKLIWPLCRRCGILVQLAGPPEIIEVRCLRLPIHDWSGRVNRWEHTTAEESLLSTYMYLGPSESPPPILTLTLSIAPTIGTNSFSAHCATE